MARSKSIAVEVVTQQILTKIENYELHSGDIISDSELAKVLGISRTPIREAITQLISKGILERRRSKVVVKSITLDDIIEIIEVRDAIESKAVELIIKKGGLTDIQKESLNNIQRDMHSSISNFDIATTFDTDHKFHTQLFEYAGNSRLTIFYNTIILQSQRLRWLAQVTPSRFLDSENEHQQILDALMKQDIKEAKKSVHFHMQRTLENYQSIISNNQILHAVSEISKL